MVNSQIPMLDGKLTLLPNSQSNHFIDLATQAHNDPSATTKGRGGGVVTAISLLTLLDKNDFQQKLHSFHKKTFQDTMYVISFTAC